MDEASLVGTLFAGRFQIEELLGRGGMGAVYRARHLILESPLAIKVILSELGAREDVSARFRREARAASRIINPHVALVYDFGYTDKGQAFIVMEYVEGESLEAAWERRPFPLDRTLSILHQVADGLAAAHASGVVHRDLKPENIILTSQDEHERTDSVKILDFGLAKLTDTATLSELTSNGVSFGTPEYMSPEQCADSRIDHRSDLYSFGVLAFRLLTGRVPFSGTILKVMSAHVSTVPPRPSELAVEPLPPAVDRLVLRCLAKNPADRYTDARAIVDELAAIRRVLGEAAPLCPTPSELVLGPEATTPDGFLDAATNETRAEEQRTNVDRPELSPGLFRLAELALAVRERNLAWPELTEAAAELLAEEDRAIAAQSELGALVHERAELEIRAERRQARLRAGLAQLEREQRAAGLGGGATAGSRRRQPIKDPELAVRLDRSTGRLMSAIQLLGSTLESQTNAIEARLSELELELGRAKEAVAPLQQRLWDLLRRVRRDHDGLLDEGLLELFDQAGIV